MSRLPDDPLAVGVGGRVLLSDRYYLRCDGVGRTVREVLRAGMFTLVVMAAGVGSRYGGAKQLAPVGPRGEAFLDFTIADAVAAGASKAVIVVRTQIEVDIRRHVEARLHSSGMADLDVVYVRQDEHGPARAKPWGTAHAALAAASEVPGPFMICNADDYYGAEAISALGESLGCAGDDEALLCGYLLGFTLPEHGAVSRGVCTVEGDRLLGIVEHHGVVRTPDGAIVSSSPEAVLGDDTVVSMNLWGFPRAMLDWAGEGFSSFLAEHGDDPEAEFILPAVVASKMAEGALRVRVEETGERWTGITHPQDLTAARSMLARCRS